jgi:signal transduction histidine kinase
MDAKRTILIIDDEEAMCDLCHDVLLKQGYNIGTAGDGDVGLQRVREMKPDLVLVDLKLPGKGGMEVLEEIKDFDPNTICIVITGYASIESAVQAVKSGAYDYLPKPFSLDQLVGVAKRGLEKRQLVLESAALRKEKERMKELFISMVTHQLRSPLTAVQGYFDLILGDIITDTTEQKKMLERAHERIKGLLTLTNDWLKMSEIDKEKVEEGFESIDISPILSETVDLLRDTASGKDVSLELDPPEGSSVVRGDTQLLREVFTNLIENGIKYNRNSGVVKITTKENCSCVIVEILDTGLGIPEKDVPFVFDQFFRVKTEDTRQIQGTGLGLSIVKRVIDAHSGLVEVTSEIGKGSVFTVRLPKPEKADKK